ncbi:hypothetical protein D3C86_1429080 [compost metagenome]
MHQLPDVPVGILKAAGIHEAVILHGFPITATGGKRRCDHPVDFVAASRRETRQNLGGARRIGDVAVDEIAETPFLKKHHEDVFFHDHAERAVVRIFRIEAETESREEAS